MFFLRKFIIFVMLFIILFTIPVFASPDEPIQTEESHIISEKEDYIAFDSETVAGSIDLFCNNLKPIANIALYGMLILFSVFSALEIIHKIAS